MLKQPKHTAHEAFALKKKSIDDSDETEGIVQSGQPLDNIIPSHVIQVD